MKDKVRCPGCTGNGTHLVGEDVAAYFRLRPAGLGLVPGDDIAAYFRHPTKQGPVPGQPDATWCELCGGSGRASHTDAELFKAMFPELMAKERALRMRDTLGRVSRTVVLALIAAGVVYLLQH